MSCPRLVGCGALIVATSLLSVACAAGEGLACSDVGASSGIQVSLPRFRTDHSPITVTACADDHCVTVRRPDGDRRLRQVQVGRSLDSRDPVSVSVVARDRRRNVLFRGRATITPQKFTPNGPGCEPTAYVGAVHGHGRRTLTPEKLGLG